jgi:hypothetical protein
MIKINDINKLIFDCKPRLTIGFIQIPGDINLDMEVGPLLSQLKNVCWRMQKINLISEKLNEDTF